MKKLLYVTVLLSSYLLTAQSADINKLSELKDTIYFADRDSAYVDPYLLRIKKTDLW